MLQDILNGQEKSRFILITDEADSCGRCLLLNLISELLQRHSHVIVACHERSPQFFKSWLPHDVQNKVKFIQPAPPCESEDEQNSYKDVFHDITKTVDGFGQQQNVTAVVLDSLSVPLFVSDTPSVCQAIHRLSKANSVSQVVALLHRDVHEEGTLRLLAHQASSVLELSPGPLGTHTCHVRHCRHTGKVLKSLEVFKVDNQCLIQDIQPLSKVDNSSGIQHSSQPEQNDPTSQLTFNLSLTSSEKEARSQVVLPYLKDRSKPEEPAASEGQGRIYYQADDADDLDEEDPDDDLNI